MKRKLKTMNSKSKTILITGGAGFIGSHLCEKFVKENHEVICVDNLFTGSKKNIQNLFDYKNFEFIRHDITFPLYLEVDEIYNLACPASPKHYQKDPISTVKTNVHGAINMLGLANRTNAKIFQASTSEIYGDPEQHPQPETYNGNVNPIGIRACYDEGKRCAETLFFDYYRQRNVNIRVARIFNTYGPKMQPDDGRVVSNFILQALKNEPITIYGDGSQTRSFCFVDDLIEGIHLFMNSNFIGPLNLGNPNEFTILELANMILELTNSRSRVNIKYIPLPQDDPKIRKPDITTANSLFDWNPKINLEKGLQKTIYYFEELLRNEKEFSS